MRHWAMLVCLAGAIGLALSATAQEQARSAAATTAVAPPSASARDHDSAARSTADNSARMATEKAARESTLRIEGEKRFRTNCGRCHMAPHKFPPRVMATAIRHMRVRAMLTDEDMRLILGYMTQ